jgi:phage/conjugal plasmid C-4 type zinc finger TraR family protein
VADWLDEASELSQAQHEKAIANRVVYSGISEEFCVECGDDIPEARRVAVPGCKYCVDCQQLKERGKI